MSQVDVAAFINQLRQVLPQAPPIDTHVLKVLHEKRDYEGLVRKIRSAMNLEARLLIGWVNSGGPTKMLNAPAWVQMPEAMPYYGTPEFKKLSIKLFVRKSFLEQSTYGQAAIVIAHELSHVVLDSIQHPLRREEKAVDLTAMLLGFSRLYDLNAHTEVITEVTRKATRTEHRQLGYLTKGELSAASKILNPFCWRLGARFSSGMAKNFIRYGGPQILIIVSILIYLKAKEIFGF